MGNGKTLLCNCLHKQIYKEFRQRFLEIAKDSGEEKQQEAILSTNNQNILWSPCAFDQADKSCFKVGPGVYMPSGFAWCNVTSPVSSYINIYIYMSGNSDTFQFPKLKTELSLNCQFWWSLLLHDRHLFSSQYRCSPPSQQPSVAWFGHLMVV